jgi:predicted signal transduction protein with EAL and GGDEF domain
MGDRLLLEVARRIKGTIRASDIVARQGGDEFIVALRRLTNGSEAAVIAEKLVEVLSRPIMIDDHRLTVGASVGIALYPRDGSTQEDLLRNADAAMYEAKRGGRSQYVFYSPVLNTQAMSFAVTVTRLRNALATGGFQLYYQPVISAQDKRIVSFEALIRAKDDELGDPAHFIPVAERTGLIAEIGEWVVVEACSQLRRWIDAGHNPPQIAINVSPTQFRDQALIRTLGEALAFARIPPHLIEIELTETTLMERIDEAREALLWLRAQGIKVAIDDFGTGYSSLAYLERLPIDRLKIDRSFVSEVGQAGRGKVATAIIGLAKSLSLEVIAEGVENELQAAWLAEMGCDYLQGYYLGRPIPARAITDLLS